MDGHALSGGDVADDGLPFDGRAAFGQADHLPFEVADPEDGARPGDDPRGRLPDERFLAEGDAVGRKDGRDEPPVDDDLAQPDLAVKALQVPDRGPEDRGQPGDEMILFPQIGGDDVVAELLLPKPAAQGRARRPVPEIEPSLDLLPGPGGRGGAQQAPRRRPVLGRHDLHDVAALEDGLEGRGGAVDPGPRGPQPDLRVDLEGEIEGRGPRRKVDDAAFGREDEDLFGDEVRFEAPQEFLGVLLLLVEGGHLPEPVQAAVLLHRARGLALFVAPVRGDAVLGQVVHFPGADLDLEGLLALGDDGRMQGLVEIGLGHGDEIPEPLRQVRPPLVDDPQGGVAVLDGVRHDAQGQEIVHLVETDLAAAHLAPDAVGPLDAGEDLGRDAVLLEQALERPLHGLEVLLGRLLVRLDEDRHLDELLGGDVAEGEILELGPDAAHPEAVGDRGIDLERFAGDLLPLRFVEVFQGLEIMDPVGQLDEDDADVVGHGQDDLADGRGPAGLR